VQAAIRQGGLTKERFIRYRKLYDEVSRLEARKKQRELMLARVRKGSL
jgi:hypothetical protein